MSNVYRIVYKMITYGYIYGLCMGHIRVEWAGWYTSDGISQSNIGFLIAFNRNLDGDLANE
jgi:hypothetical protein